MVKNNKKNIWQQYTDLEKSNKVRYSKQYQEYLSGLKNDQEDIPAVDLNYFDLPELSNIIEESKKKEEETGFVANIKNLWRVINHDMDEQSVSSAINDVREAAEEKEDLRKIQDYVNSVKQLDILKNKLETKQYTNVKEQQDDIDAFLNISKKIADYDSYFMGDGRTHKVIADNMFNGAKMSTGEIYSTTLDIIKRGWGKRPELGWSRYGTFWSLAGTAIESLLHPVAGTVGVAGELISGAYNEIKDLYKRITSDEYSNSSRVNEYIRNFSKSDDALLKRLYLGKNIVNREGQDADLSEKIKDANRTVNEKIADLQEAQHDLKNANLFGIDGAYNYDAVSEDWISGRKEYQDGSFWGAFLHPFYATADIASSLDMMKYQIYAKGVDTMLRHLPQALLKKAPVVGTIAAAADIAAGVGATVASREEETGLEAIGAIGNRVALLAQQNGANLLNVLTEIKRSGKMMGIDTDALPIDQLWQLGVALNINTGDEAFEKAKEDAQKGINRLINANNALGIMDYAQMLPYMSYSGDVVRSLKGFGRNISGASKNTRIPLVAENKTVRQMAMENVDGVFDGIVNKAARNFMLKDMPKNALRLKHMAKYAKNKAKTILGTSTSESLEEGVQTKLTNQYLRGEYDTHNSNASMFDLGEIARNTGLAAQAISDYIGAVNPFDEGSIDGEDVRRAMNMGFWSSIIQGGMMHSLTNLTGSTLENIRGLARQLKDDAVAVRILADLQKTLLDHSHVGMFYDRFMRGAQWNDMITALNDLKDLLNPNVQRKSGESDDEYRERVAQARQAYQETGGLIKQQFIDDDIKLMSAVWTLFNDKSLTDFLAEHGINKQDLEYRQFLIDGATALMDYHKTSELAQEQVEAINKKQEDHINLVTKMIAYAMQEDQIATVNANPKLAKIVDNLKQKYQEYSNRFNPNREKKYNDWAKKYESFNNFYEDFLQDIISNGIDEDIAESVEGEDRIYQQAQRIFGNLKKRSQLIKNKYEKQERQSFYDSAKSLNSLKSNRIVRNAALNHVRFEEDINPYLERLYANDKDGLQELLDEAYNLSTKPKSELEFVTDYVRLLHNLKKRRAILNSLTWIENQEEVLKKIRKMTGLDVDPSKIKGWIDYHKQQLENLRKAEQLYVGDNNSFDDIFGDETYEFDDEEEYNELLSNYFINKSIQKAQGHVANLYRSLQATPTVLKDAIFGKDVTGTILDDIANEFKTVLDRRNSRSEADRRIGVDDAADLDDMKAISKKAAWKIIEDRLKLAERRRKIVHRKNEELQQERNAAIEQTISEVATGVPERDTEKTIEETDAERALREEFYHEGKKKADVEEEIRNRKKRTSEQAEDAEDEDVDEKDIDEEAASSDDDTPEVVDLESQDEDVSDIENAPVESVPSLDEEPSPSIDSSDDIEGGDVNTDNIEDTIDSIESGIETIDDASVIDEDMPTLDQEDILDETMLLENDLGEITYDGDPLLDEVQDAIRDEMDLQELSEKAPVHIDETRSFDDSEKTENIVGEPGPNLIWQTLFYGYNLDVPPIIMIGGKLVAEFNGKPLKPGSELAKKLTNPDWLRGAKKYYIVTQSQEAANNKNDKDAFTVAMIIEDDTASYATFYRTVTTNRVSISTTLKGKDGLPMKFHTNDRETLENDLLLHNMDQNKILNAVRQLDINLYRLLSAVYAVVKANASDKNAKKIYNKLIVLAYKLAIDAYAKELFAQNYASLHINDPKAKDKGYRDWGLMTSSIVKYTGESDEQFEARKKNWESQRQLFEYSARKYYAKPKRVVFSQDLISKEIDKLKATRDEIIDAYLTKNGKDYVFPESAQIGKVEPEIVSQSNGKINSQRTSGDLPKLRNIMDENISMQEIQDLLEDETLLIGIGKGMRASADGKRPIVKWGFDRTDEAEIVYEDGGCSGKIYMMIPGVDGKLVPVMLSEEKYNILYRETSDGKVEPAIINNSRKVELCIDPRTKQILGGKKVKPSAAEVLLYMILGELNIPGLEVGQHSEKDKGNLTDLVALFINADAKTLLGQQPGIGDDLMLQLAAKQLYYGTDVNKIRKKTESGKEIVVSEASEGEMKFHIGMKLTISVEVPDGKGGVTVEQKEIYREEVYTKELILYTGTENESADDLRARIIQAIATQMHWNTDNFTFGQSAAVDASKTILGRLVEQLLENDFLAGRFDGMSPGEIFNSTVSIMDCPQLSFKISDFYEAAEGVDPNNITSFDQLKPIRGSVLAWMIKAGHLKTDLGDTNFRDPFVFGHGVKNNTRKPAAEQASAELNAPVQPAVKIDNSVVVSDTENVFAEEHKEKEIVGRLSSIPGMSKSGIGIPKTKKEAQEKMKTWVDFLLGSTSKNKKFADRIDVENNDILDMILLQARDDEDICEYSESVGDIISLDDDEGLEKYNEELRNDQLKRLILQYNLNNKTQIEYDKVERGTLKKYGKLLKTEVEAVVIYKDKKTGEVKVLFDTINGPSTSDKTVVRPDQRHYFVKAATGVFSQEKSKGKFEAKKAKKWLSDKLGIDPANVMVWDTVKSAYQDKEVYGAVDTVVNTITGELLGVIGLSSRGGNSIHYHEAWHYVNLLMLSEDERQDVYQSYLNTHKAFKRKKPTNREIEERLAEEFRNFVLHQEDTSLIGKIIRIFDNILDFIFLFRNRALYKQQFKKIAAGEYKNAKISKANLEYFMKEWRVTASINHYVPGINKSQNENFEYITNHQEYFNASKAIATKIVQEANIRTEKDVRRVSGQDYGEMIQSVNDWINTSEDLNNDQKNILRDVMKNEDLVRRSVKEAFEELGLLVKIRTIRDEAREREDEPDNTWDKFDLAVSKRDNAAFRAKLFMKLIPVLQRVINEDGTVSYEEKLDSFGLIETYSFKEAWNLIVENLWQCESLDDSDANGYLPTSLMGMIENLRDSNEFYESLYRSLSGISGNKWADIELRSQIYTTINSNKPQVSYLRLDDPLERANYSDDIEDSDVSEEVGITRNLVAADITRTWSIKNDNEEEISKNLPRDWSRALTAHGLITTNKDGNSIISKAFADRLSNILSNLRKELEKTPKTEQELDVIMDKVVQFYREMAIPLDKTSLWVMLRMQEKDPNDITDKKAFKTIKSWFSAKLKDSATGEQRLNTLPLMADAIISAAGKSTVRYGGDKRERLLDQLYANFSTGHHITKIAKAINIVHPSSREFSIKGPNGERIYPISQNSFVSDRVRKLSTSNGQLAQQMKDASKYCSASDILDISIQYTKPFDSETHFKLNAFVGIKDVNRGKGADYFGITPMEDYIAKMIMTEDDQIILPTMADKKTWYSISHKELHLCHDTMLVMPYKEFLHKVIYEEYEKEYGQRKEDVLEGQWTSAAERWYSDLDKNSKVRKQIDKKAEKLYVEDNNGVLIMRYSDDTLKRFGKYMLSELDSIILYYDEDNIRRLTKTCPEARIENYHGDVKNGRMDFSGNGGKFRYFYDVLTFLDDSKNKVRYNLNQRLLYLFELQKKIEAGQVVDISSDDPIYKYVGTISMQDKDELDGFELIRQELKRIKEEHFKMDKFISKDVKDNINKMLIELTQQELDNLSEPNSPYKLVDKRKDGMYIPNGIPVQLIRKYAKKISKSLTGEELSFDTTKGKDKYLMQDALFSLIANYVANSAISTIEFEKVFSGDPAFYSRKTISKIQRVEDKKSLPKKGKFGVVYITSDNEKAYEYSEGKYLEIADKDLIGVTRITRQIQLQDGSIARESVIVDNVWDSYSDKIKRLGSALSPGDEMRLHYTPEELEKHKELSITEYTNMNVEDIKALSIYMDYMTDIFKKLLLIDHIRSINPDKFKDYCKTRGIQFEKAISRIYTDQEFYNEVYNLYSEIHEAVEDELDSQLDPYDGITVADAQVFVRPELYRKIRIGLGQWTSDDERAYKIIESSEDGEWLNDEKLYKAVRRLELFPLKMSYFQNDPDPFNHSVTPMLNKMAVFPLFKFQATSEIGLKLYKRMNKAKNELDMISFKSAVKVGASQHGAKMCKDDAPVEDQLRSIDELFDAKSSQYIDYRKNDKAGNPNAKYGSINSRHGEGVAPVQIQSLENLRMQLNTQAHKDEDRNIGTQMFKLAFSNIIDDAHYGDMTGSEIKADIMRIVNELTDFGIETIHSRFFTDGQPDPDKIKSYIQTVVKNNGLGASAEEIINEADGVAAGIASRKVFENSVTSVVNAEVVDINTTGGTAIQQSSFGFVGYGKQNVESQTGAYKINYNNGEELKWSREDGSMEVILSMNFLKQVLPDDMKNKPFVELKKWLIEHDIIKGTKEDGTESNPKPFGVGYRIPTQGLSSMFAFVVADVMPESVGDLIIVPREFTALTGSDFDVDKLFLATMSYMNGQLVEDEADFIGDDRGNIKRALTNKLLKYYITLLTDKKNYANTRASIDVLTSKLKKDFVQGVIRANDSGYIPGFHELTPSFLVNRKREFSIGKAGIAPFALNVTNLSLTQRCHLTMRYDGVVSEYGFGSLDAIYGRDGRRIADWLSAMVNAHVDVAKDPYIFDLNINHATYNYANFLLRAGMGMSTFTFLAQLSLKNIADEINNAGGIYGGNIDGSTPESEMYKSRKKKAIKNEQFAILKRLRNIRTRLEQKEKTKKVEGDLSAVNELIAYIDYLILSDSKRKEKYGDKIPQLGIERVDVFNEEVAILAIDNGRSSDDSKLIEYYRFQLAAIRCFSDIANHAQAISSLVSASLIDTKKFGNTIKEHINFKNKIDHMYEDSDVFWTINEDGFDSMFTDDKKGVDKKAAQKEAMRRYYEESYLSHKFDNATQLIKQILSSQLLSATDQFETIFTDVFRMINGERESGIYEKELSADKINTMGDAIDNIMRFNAMFNAGRDVELDGDAFDFTLGGDISAVITKWREILFGSDKKKPLYERISQLKTDLKDPKKQDDYWDLLDENGEILNELLDILIPQSPNQNQSVGKITLAESLMDADGQSRRKLISSFAQLLSSENEEVKDIATDLMFYAYYSAYDQNTVNSFFDLVPVPFRKQYDKALSKVLTGLNSNDEDLKSEAVRNVSGRGIDDIIDVICRNYWYSDEIVPKYYVDSKSEEYGSFNSRGGAVYGSNQAYGKNFGFPRFIAFTSDDKIKGNKYLKMLIGRDILLYRKIGEVKRINKETGKPGSSFNVFAPIPKAGLHQNGTHQFEFYANYDTPSVFEDNRVSSNFSHELVRKEVIEKIEKVNDDSNGEFTCEPVWNEEQILPTYDKLNRETYTELRADQYSESVNRVALIAPTETNGRFTDPEQIGIRAADVVVDIESDNNSSIKYKEGDNKYGIDPKYKDKVVTLNAHKILSQSLYDKIKGILQESKNRTKRIYVHVGKKSQINISDADILEYLVTIGLDSNRAKELLEKTEVLNHAVRQFKVNKLLTDTLRRLNADGFTNIYLDCSFFGTTWAAEAVQFAALAGVNVKPHVHMSSYSLFENPKLGKTLKSIMRYRFGEFKGYDTEAAADVVAEVAEKQDLVDQEVKKKIDDVLGEANNDPDVLESSQAFDLSSKLGNSKPDDTEKPTPKILEQASQYEENKDEAADQECGIASADDMLDIL